MSETKKSSKTKWADIRKPVDKSLAAKILDSLLILAFGIAMGTVSKMLDGAAFNELPRILQYIDIVNFLNRFGIWIFIAVCISIYSSTAKRAALNVFLFFAGMVASYYFYSAFILSFISLSYALIWAGITLVSPLLGAVCWYAKGKGTVAVIITGLILGVMLSQAIFLFQSIRITFVPEVVLWSLSIFILRRKPGEFIAALVISVGTAALIQLLLPFWG